MNSRFSFYLAVMLCALPLVAVLMPRALTVFPALFAVSGLLIYRVQERKWPALNGLVFLLISALIGLMGLSVLWAFDPAEALERTLKAAPVLLGGALLFSLARISDASYFVRWFPYAALLATMICVLELYAGAPIYHLAHDPMRDNNMFFLNRSTALIVLMMPVAVTCLRLGNDKYKKFLYALLALFLIAALYRTDSQSSQLALLIGLPFYFLFPANSKTSWLAVGMALIVLIIASPWIAHEAFRVLPAYLESNTLARRGYALYRLEIWDFVARRALESPLYGHGVEATKAITDFDTQMLYHKSREVLHPHNFALQLWIEFGILGPVYAAVFFAALLNGIRKMSPLQARTAAAVLFASISIASTGYGLWQAMWLGAFGMLAAYCALIARESPK